METQKTDAQKRRIAEERRAMDAADHAKLLKECKYARALEALTDLHDGIVNGEVKGDVVITKEVLETLYGMGRRGIREACQDFYDEALEGIEAVERRKRLISWRV